MNTGEIHSSKTWGAVANQFGFNSIKKLDEMKALAESEASDSICDFWEMSERLKLNA
jgi:hypothetical protein